MLLLGTLAAFFAYLVKGMTGFANTLVFSSILSFATANRNITPVDLLLGFPANVFIAWRERARIRMRIVLPLVVMLVIGMVPGSLLLLGGNERLIKLLLGAVIIALAADMFVRDRRAGNAQARPAVLTAIGVVSGFLCGLFGIGAFIAAYMTRTTQNMREMRANLCIVFSIENAVRIVLFWALGLLNTGVLWTALALVPGMLLGLLCGMWLARRVPEAHTRRIVQALLLLMGLSVILTNV